ncbi:MAG: cytochrome-c peroxidase, partial [Schlesneria sp.]
MKYVTWLMVVFASIEALNAQPGGRPSVVLGTPNLTNGIPGKGDLTIEEIKTWLDKKANNRPLEVVLPVGLALGANNIS